MARVSIAFSLFSTVLLFVAFGKGISSIHSGDITAHYEWATAALLSCLASNLMGMVHAAQSDRIIRSLRALIPEHTLKDGD